MFQFSFIVLLALSISANFVFTLEVFQADTASLQNESPVGALKTNNQTNESPKTHKEPTKNVAKNNSTLKGDQQKAGTSKEQAKNSTATSLASRNKTLTSSVENVTSNITRPTEETTPMTAVETVTQKAGNFTGEQANLNQCCVHPPDGDEKDDVTIETPKENVTAVGSTLGTTPPSIVVSVNVPNDSAPLLNTTMYKTFPPELDNVTEATTSNISNSTVAATIASITTTPTPAPTPTAAPTTAPTTPTTAPTPTTASTVSTTSPINASTVLKNNQTKNKNGRLAMEGVENLQQAGLSEKNQESSDGSKNESMPPGIIALVTAISFAVAIAIGYISMIVWKQYLEHRYGRRELLVNELEFDTNDLRHFEL